MNHLSPSSGIHFAWRFAFLNAIVFQIATGTPLVLYAKSLGASATTLGIIASMMPLLTVLQLPAAHLLPRYGYRKFMMSGWGLRTIMVFGLAGTPLLFYADQTTKLSLVLVLIFSFSLLRGISSGAWMPWITEIVPEEKRGLYLSGEQWATYAGSLAALGVSAIALAWLPDPARYSAIFLLSGFAGIASLAAIRRMPDVEAPEKLRSSAQPVPWLVILRFPPFFRLLIFNLLWVSTASGVPIFAVSWLRETGGFAESQIIGLSLAGFAGAMLTLPLTPKLLDRAGSKPILRIMTLLAVCMILGWTSLAGGMVSVHPLVVGLLYLVSGVVNANFAVANARLSMATMPPMGRNHFFALFTVLTSLASGVAPVLWGMIIDSLHDLHGQILGMTATPYSIYFAISSMLMVATSLAVSLLHEATPGVMTERDYTILGNLKRNARTLQK